MSRKRVSGALSHWRTYSFVQGARLHFANIHSQVMPLFARMLHCQSSANVLLFFIGGPAGDACRGFASHDTAWHAQPDGSCHC
jgi:hypothetical protein